MTKNIIIIGAGAAGLMTASELVNRNYHITVLEARDRIGGRIHTLADHFSKPVDIGAEFIHGDQPITTELAKESRTLLQRLAGNHFRIAKGELKEGDFFDAGWDEMLNELAQLTTDMPMSKFLDKHFNPHEHSDFYTSIKGFVEGFDAADLDKVSALALKEEWMNTDDEHQYHLKDNYISLLLHLQTKITSSANTQIMLSAPVRTILWTAGRVQVILNDERILEADKVIVTVPMGVLQRRDILFVPDIPQHQRAFEQIGFGGVIKFIFEFDQPFWEHLPKRPLKDVAFIFSDAPVPTWWSQLPDNATLLTGWMGGPATQNLDRTNNALYDRARSSLAYIFDCSQEEIQQHVRQFYIADWVQDPYAHGAYAYSTVTTPDARKLLMAPIENTIYFAGEAIYEGPAMGTVEAALASGRSIASVISAEKS